MRTVTRWALAAASAVAVVLVHPPGASAQQRGGGETGGTPRERAELERRFGQRIGRAVQERLQLTDAQTERLRRSNRSFEEQRRALVAEEREVRLALRAQLAPGATAQQERVSELIDQAIHIQRKRLDLVESEQRELARFLTPVQRARYLDLQERLRHRVEEIRRGHPGRGGGAPTRRLRPRS